MWMAVFAQFCFIMLRCDSSIMHILPLPPCGLYSIRAQNGYGQHRPCKIVLLTLVTPSGVTNLYLSWGINIEHARTAYRKACGTEYQQPYRRFYSRTPYEYFNWNIAQACSMSVSDVRITQLAKLSFNHPSVVLTADVFQFFTPEY